MAFLIVTGRLVFDQIDQYSGFLLRYHFLRGFRYYFHLSAPNLQIDKCIENFSWPFKKILLFFLKILTDFLDYGQCSFWKFVLDVLKNGVPERPLTYDSGTRFNFDNFRGNRSRNIFKNDCNFLTGFLVYLMASAITRV